jgi:hypothetical protein
MLACVLVLLSVSLFSWGLRYKLSLYYSHQDSPKMAAAKLLSQKERPATAQATQLVAPIVPGPALHVTRIPSVQLASLTRVRSLERRSRHSGDCREFFTVHTDRKPPPNVAG